MHTAETFELDHIPVVLIWATLRMQGATTSNGGLWGHADGFILEPVEGDLLASTLRNVLEATQA